MRKCNLSKDVEISLYVVVRDTYSGSFIVSRIVRYHAAKFYTQKTIRLMCINMSS